MLATIPLVEITLFVKRIAAGARNEVWRFDCWEKSRVENINKRTVKNTVREFFENRVIHSP
jgi:hypothetical protein